MLKSIGKEFVEEKPKLLTNCIVRYSPLEIRDALYGGWTEAMRLHYKIGKKRR